MGQGNELGNTFWVIIDDSFFILEVERVLHIQQERFQTQSVHDFIHIQPVFEFCKQNKRKRTKICLFCLQNSKTGWILSFFVQPYYIFKVLLVMLTWKDAECWLFCKVRSPSNYLHFYLILDEKVILNSTQKKELKRNKNTQKQIIHSHSSGKNILLNSYHFVFLVILIDQHFIEWWFNNKSIHINFINYS